MSGPYDDIIHLPHPVSSRHAPMSRQDRAAQFSAFAALTGYEDAIQETGRLTDHWDGPDEEARNHLDEQFQLLREHGSAESRITVTYFVPDNKKDGGSFETVTGILKAIDDQYRCLRLRNGCSIPFSAICGLEL